MGELAKRLRKADPKGFKDWTDDDLEVSFLKEHGREDPGYSALADTRNRIYAQNLAVEKADQGVAAAAQLEPSIKKNFVEKAADVAAPYLEPLQAPVTGLGMIADMVQTGGKNIKVHPEGQGAEGFTGMLTGGATLDKSLAAQTVDSLRRRLALSTNPYQPDPSKGNIENLLGAIGHGVGAATGVGLGGLGMGDGSIPGEEQHIRQSFEKTNPNYAIAEAAAEPAAEMMASMIVDPGMAGLHALGGLRTAGQAAQTALRSGAAMTPEMAAQAVTAANRGRIAGAAGGALGAAFIPGMAGGGGTGIGTGLAALDSGNKIEAARNLSQGTMDLGFATMAGKHLYEGLRPKGAAPDPPQAAPEGQEPPKNMLERMREGAAKKLAQRPQSDPEPETNKPAGTQGRNAKDYYRKVVGPVSINAGGDVKVAGIGVPGPREVAGDAAAAAAFLGVGALGGVVPALATGVGGFMLRRQLRNKLSRFGKPLENAMLRRAGFGKGEATAESKPAGTVGTPDPAVTGPASGSSDTLRQGAPAVEGMPTTTEAVPGERAGFAGRTSTVMPQMSVPMPEGVAPTTPALDPIREAKRVALIKDLRQMTTRNPGETLADFTARVAAAADRMLEAQDNQIPAPPRRAMSVPRSPEQIEADRALIEAAKARMANPTGAPPPPAEPPMTTTTPAVFTGPKPEPTVEERFAAEKGNAPDLLRQLTEAADRSQPTGTTLSDKAGPIEKRFGEVVPAEKERLRPKSAEERFSATKAEGPLTIEQMVAEAVKAEAKAKEHADALKKGTHPKNKSGLDTKALEATEDFKKVLTDFNAGKLRDTHNNLITNEKTARAIAFSVADKAAFAAAEASKRAAGPSLEGQLKASVATAPATSPSKIVQVAQRVAAEKAAPALAETPPVRQRFVVVLGGKEKGQVAEVIAQRQGGPSERAGRGRRPNDYKVRLADGTEIWVNARGLRNATAAERAVARKSPEPPKKTGRTDVKTILANPEARRELMTSTIQATQAREGIETTREQAQAAYDKVQAEKAAKKAQEEAKAAPQAAPEAQKSAQKAPEGAQGVSPRKSVKALLDAGDYENAAKLARENAVNPDKADPRGRKVGYVMADGKMVVDIDSDGYAEVTSPTRPQRGGSKVEKQYGIQWERQRDKAREGLIWANRDVPGQRYKSVVQYRLYGPNSNGKYTVSISGDVIGGQGNKPIESFKAGSAAEARELAAKHFRENYGSEGFIARTADNAGGMKVDERYSGGKSYSVEGKSQPMLPSEVREARQKAGARIAKEDSLEGSNGFRGVKWPIKDGTQRYRMEVGDHNFSGMVTDDAVTMGRVFAPKNGAAVVDSLRAMAKKLGKEKIQFTSTNKINIGEDATGSVTAAALKWRDKLEAKGEGRTLPNGRFELFTEKSGKAYSIEEEFGKQGLKGPKSAERELLRMRTSGDTKDIGPAVPRGKGELTPPDSRTKRPFAEDYLDIEDMKRHQPVSKGEQYGLDSEGNPVGTKITGKKLREALPESLRNNVTRDAETRDYLIETPRGTIRIRPEDRIEIDFSELAKHYSPEEVARAKAEGMTASGVKTTIGGEALIQIVKLGKLGHEMTHVAWDHFANAKESALFKKNYEGFSRQAIGEKLARAYEALDTRLKNNPEWQPTNVVGKVLKRAYDFFNGVYRAWRPNEESFLRGVRSGKIFERAAEDVSDTGMVAPNKWTPKRVSGDRSYIVTPEQAKGIDMKTTLPDTPEFHEAVKNTIGASVDSDGLHLKLIRFQKPEQAGEQSVRTGVFYLPEKASQVKNYRTSSKIEHGFAGTLYGGTDKISGETVVRNPLVIRGSTGGKVPEAAFDRIMGKGASKKLWDDTAPISNAQFDRFRTPDLRKLEADYEALDSTGKNYLADRRHLLEAIVYERGQIKLTAVKALLKDHGANPGLANAILYNSKHGNQLGYALRENIIAHAVREAGYDSVLGHNRGKFTEFFDVREAAYPVQGEEAMLHPKFEKEYSIGPRGAGSSLGRQLKEAEGLRKPERVGKGSLYTQKTDMTPRLAPKENPLERATKSNGKPVSNANTMATDGAIAPKSYSIDSLDETMRAAEEFNTKNKVFEPEKMKRFSESIHNVAAIIHNDIERLGYKALKGASSLKENSDPQYGLSEDFTTLCVRRMRLADTLDAIQGGLKKMMTPDQWIDVVNEMEKQGHEVSCGPCYVESRRRNMKTAIDKAVKGWDRPDKNAPGGSVHLKLKPEFASKAITQEGRDWLFENHPDQYSIISKSFVGTQMKIPLGRAEYRSEILKLKQSGNNSVDSFNRFSGIRSQSWSDFEVPHLLDKMQSTLDKSLRGLMGHSYTKESNYVRLMKRTNEFINMSRIPKGAGLDAKGNLVYNEKQSIRDMDEMRGLRKQHNNIGFEDIGVSDAHIKKLLANPETDYVIPFHASGPNEAHLSKLGMGEWTDYGKRFKNEFGVKTSAQDWVDVKTGEPVHDPNRKVFINEWKGDYKKLWKLAKERGVRPPFPEFKDHPNYYKLLTDRRAFDKSGKYIEQKPVEFNFDMNDAKKMLDDYRGGHKFGQPVEDIVEHFTKKFGREKPDMLADMISAAKKKLGRGSSRKNTNY